MQAATYTKTGNKATTAAKLNKSVFGVELKNHELLKQAYVAYQANGRINLAKTKTRGEVRGGGKKPWRQKGTGRARFGSIRVPLWRGGGITFGPLGVENYSKKLNVKTKRTALKQALTLAAADNKIKVVDNFPSFEGKTKDISSFLTKIDATGQTLFVLEAKDSKTNKERAAKNIPNLKLCSANYLNVADVLDADAIVISNEALKIVEKWLGGKHE